jgi:bifunctional enzyme CysN/CysC
VKASVSKLFYAIDVDTLHRRKADTYGLNDIGRVAIQTASPIFFDPYKNNRATGSFILIDPNTNQTVAAGTIRGIPMTLEDLLEQDGPEAHPEKSPHAVWSEWNIPRRIREEHGTHQAAVLWFTGFSGSGKSTLAKTLERRLFQQGCRTMLLDGDQLRHGLCRDLGFSRLDRSENIRRVSEVARLFFESGHIVLCTFISPFERDRALARGLIPAGRFFEIHVQCDLETCIERDPHGLYKKALHGEIPDFTGISSPYEQPEHPEIILSTTDHPVEPLVEQLLGRLKDTGIL